MDVQPYMLYAGEKSSGAIYYDVDHAREQILAKAPEDIARLAGVTFLEKEQAFTFTSLGQSITVDYPSCQVHFTKGGEKPALSWQLAILHYLVTADGVPLSGKWVPFREYERHVAHPTVFEHDTGQVLVDRLGNKPAAKILEACGALGADIEKSSADVCAVFHLLPRFPIKLNLWLSDEELPGSGGLLFDSRSAHYLPVEDLHTTGPMVVNFLACQYAAMFD